MKTDGLKYSAINLKEFSKEFHKRHDFNSEDLGILKNNFPQISFENIPEAWIIPIDKMLRLVANDVCSVKQYYGLLCIKEKDPGSLDLSVVDRFEKILYTIDKDLHDRLSILNG